MLFVHRRETTPITTALAPPVPTCPHCPDEAPPRLVDVSNKLVRPKRPESRQNSPPKPTQRNIAVVQ